MNAMSLLTRGYICPTTSPDDEIILGEGPDIVDVDELRPVIDRGRELVLPGPTIIGGIVEED
jgi:hypothetical protein